MKDSHLKESYHAQIDDLTALESKFGADHPRLSWSKAVAEETIASFYMANEDDRYRTHLKLALDLRMDWWDRGDGIGAWEFILYTCVGLAVDNAESVRRLLKLEVNEDGFVRLTVEWSRLHRALLLGGTYTPRPVKKTKGEERVFEAITQMIQGAEPDWTAFDNYWKSTRNRRHKLTILEHRNLLKDGMVNLWEKGHNRII